MNVPYSNPESLRKKSPALNHIVLNETHKTLVVNKPYKAPITEEPSLKRTLGNLIKRSEKKKLYKKFLVANLIKPLQKKNNPAS